jgi:hypothetical protein
MIRTQKYVKLHQILFLGIYHDTQILTIPKTKLCFVNKFENIITTFSSRSTIEHNQEINLT